MQLQLCGDQGQTSCAGAAYVEALGGIYYPDTVTARAAFDEFGDPFTEYIAK